MRCTNGVALSNFSGLLQPKRKTKFTCEMAPTKFNIGEIQMRHGGNKAQPTGLFIAILSSRVKQKNGSACEMLPALAGRRNGVLLNCS